MVKGLVLYTWTMLPAMDQRMVWSIVDTSLTLMAVLTEKMRVYSVNQVCIDDTANVSTTSICSHAYACKT